MIAAATTLHPWWLASRSLGVVAMLLVTASVCMGLTLSSRYVRVPGGPAWLKVAHEALALAGLAAIVGHGLLLLGDSYLHPSLGEIFVPFTMTTHTFWTGIGVLAGWLVAIITASFYFRKRIGMPMWRRLHKLTFVVFIMSVLHTVGAGTDGRQAWLLLPLLALTAVVVTLTALRAAGMGARPAAKARPVSAPPRRPAIRPARRPNTTIRPAAREDRRSAPGRWPASAASHQR